MVYKITEDCIACGACASECPTQGITERDQIYAIDASKCSGCGACAGVCPIGATVPAELTAP